MTMVRAALCIRPALRRDGRMEAKRYVNPLRFSA
jgi:hypothetical protein